MQENPLSYRVYDEEGMEVSHDIDGLPESFKSQQEFLRLVIADTVLSSIFLLVMTGRGNYSMRALDSVPKQIRNQLAQLGIISHDKE